MAKLSVRDAGIRLRKFRNGQRVNVLYPSVPDMKTPARVLSMDERTGEYAVNIEWFTEVRWLPEGELEPRE